MLLRSTVAALALGASAGAARAEYIVAPDVVVYCEPTLRPAIAAVAAAYRGETGVPVRIFSAPTPLLLEQVRHRARADLLIAEGDAALRTALAGGIVKPETRFGGWRNRLVVAAPAPAKEGNAAEVLKAVPVALVDAWAGSAGEATRRALTQLGAADAVAAQAIGVADTAEAAFLVASGKARVAIVFATDVAADPGLARAANLPDAAYDPVTYWGAETHNVLSPNTPKFAAFLKEPRAQAILRAAGLEVPS